MEVIREEFSLGSFSVESEYEGVAIGRKGTRGGMKALDSGMKVPVSFDLQIQR